MLATRVKQSSWLLRSVSKIRPVVKISQDKYTTKTDGGAGRPSIAQADNMMDIGTRSMFSAQHDMFRETARKFFREEVAPHIPQWEKDGVSSRDCWLRAGELGLLGITAPEQCGGVGGDFLHAAIAIEEQSYANAVGPGFGVHSHLVIPYLFTFGTEEQKQKYIPDMIAGKNIGALAMTEPGAGSNVQGIETRAKRDGDDWILNGSKIYITSGILADTVIVAAVTDTDAKTRAHGLSLFVVDADTKGFVKGRKLDKLGLKAQDTAELFFEDVRVPASALLGQENTGFYLLMQELVEERMSISIMFSSSCEWMFEETRNFIKEKKAFGKSLSQIQTIQHKMAELKTAICVNRSFTDQCIQLHQQKKLDVAMACMNKYWSTDLANKVAYDCVQLHGGSGFMSEYPISRAYTNVRVGPIFGGTNEIMKELIGRTISK